MNFLLKIICICNNSSKKEKALLADVEKGLKEVKDIREGKIKPLSTIDLC